MILRLVDVFMILEEHYFALTTNFIDRALLGILAYVHYLLMLKCFSSSDLVNFQRTTAEHEISHYLGDVTIFNRRLTAIGGMYNSERTMEEIELTPNMSTQLWRKTAEFPIVLALFSTVTLGTQIYVFGGMTCADRNCPDGRRWAPKYNLYGDWEASDGIFSYGANARGMVNFTVC